MSLFPAQALTVEPGSAMLCLQYVEEDRLRLLERLRAAGATPGREEVVRSVYYDTGRRKLWRAGYRLAVRTQCGKHFQDVEATSPALLAAVPCWTAEIGNDYPDHASLARTPLADVVAGGAAKKLMSIFTVDLRRRSSILKRAGCSIAARLDEGTIAAEGAVERLCELRLELISGAPDALFGLARELGSDVQLTLTLRAPSERGFRLVPQPGRPTARSPADLHEAMTLHEAADSICRSSAATLLDSLAQLSSGGGQDALHRARIGLRRMRALLWFLKPVLGAEVAELSARLRSLAQSLGTARELDVFCDRLLASMRRDNPDLPGADALFEIFDGRRYEAHEQARRLIRSPAMLDFGLDLVSSLTALSASEQATPMLRRLRERQIAAFVEARLHSRLKAFLKVSKDLRHCTPECRHDIRVKAKKLRYVVEAFQDVIGASASRKLLAKLVSLQDLLGDLNDVRNGRTIALAYAAERAVVGDGDPTLFAAGHAAAACGCDPAVMLDRAAEARDRLAALARQ